jgi:hypothetical protein
MGSWRAAFSRVRTHKNGSVRIEYACQTHAIEIGARIIEVADAADEGS